jgi:hypothetical protein
MVRRGANSWLANCVYPARRLGEVACLSAAVLFTCIGEAAAETAIGYVAELHGVWQLYLGGADSDDLQKKQLVKGQVIPEGAAIRIKTPSLDDYIVIVGLDLNILEQRRCRVVETCNSPILLPEKAKREGSAGRFASLLRDAWDRLRDESYQPSLHRVRGDALMTDGVVALRERSVDLRDIMRYARAGRYVLTRSEDTGRQQTGAQRMVFAWEPETTTTVAVGDLSPGLFDINNESAVATRSSGKDSPARVLVCFPSAYFDAASSFRKVLDVTDSWTDSIDPDTTRAFLRSLLASLEKSEGACSLSRSR